MIREEVLDVWTGMRQLNEIKYSKVPDCKKIPVNCNKKNVHLCNSKKCKRKKDGKIFLLPRLLSRKQCKKNNKGFSQRASCAPFN